MRSLTYQGITWHDDAHPAEKDLRKLQKMYNFHNLDIEDCLSQHERPKVDEYETYLFLVFHIPYLSKQSARILKEEVNIFLGADYIVTVHEGRVPVFDSVWKEIESSEEKRLEYLQHGTGYFLYELMRQLFEEGFPLVDLITKSLREIEAALFEDEDAVDLLRDILALKRNIITMRSILLPQRSLIAALEHKNEKFIPANLEVYFDNILDNIERQWSMLETAKEIAEALHGTHDSWLRHKTDAVIRVLTIFSVTILTPTLLSGIYGMNIVLPLQEHPGAFLILTTIMLAVIVGFFGYFSYKKWL